MSPDSAKWLEAMKSKKGSMYENKVWTLVDLPNDRQAIEVNGSLRRRRTWMVMSSSMKLDLWRKVFHKFKELTTMRFFSSVAMLKVRRIHVSISCIYEIWQMDVKMSFLTGFREERLYAIQSEKFC